LEYNKRESTEGVGFIRLQILSVGFDNVTMDEAVDIAVSYIIRGERCRIVTPNAEIAYQAERDKELQDIINASQLVLPDGVGVIKASRILGTPLKEKVAGIDFADQLCKRLAQTGHSLFLYGAKPGIAQAAGAKLKEKYPGLVVAGTFDGYAPEEEAIKAVNLSCADALFVCLGSPKQEHFMENNRSVLTPVLMAGLGGSLDVFAGAARRAPDLFIRLGLEWFYRLIKQPGRIGRVSRLPFYLLDAAIRKKRGKTDA